jgi:hypothetical protein
MEYSRLKLRIIKRIKYNVIVCRYGNILVNVAGYVILRFYHNDLLLYFVILFIYSFIHSIAICRMWRFLVILSSFFHPPSLHLAIYFLVYLLVLLFPNSYTILFWEFYFIPFSAHVKTNLNLYILIVSVIVSFLTVAWISLLVYCIILIIHNIS